MGDSAIKIAPSVLSADFGNLASQVRDATDAGADMIVTQLFYDIDKFFIFRDKCLSKGIDIPIIPGIMPIHNYARFRKFTEFCNVSIPKNILNKLEPIKNNDANVIQYGIEQGSIMCEKLIKEDVPGLHFYTLNLEHSVKEILHSIGLVTDQMQNRDLPWRQSSDEDRKSSEDVRPIFWSNRSKTYIYRTRHWDEFPNGRWGNSASPAFGELKEIGSVAYKLGLTAAGQADIFASLRPKNEWDICAGTCIIQEAGGKVIDLNGNNISFNQEKTLIEPGLIAGDIQAVDKTYKVLTTNI